MLPLRTGQGWRQLCIMMVLGWDRSRACRGARCLASSGERCKHQKSHRRGRWHDRLLPAGAAAPQGRRLPSVELHRRLDMGSHHGGARPALQGRARSVDGAEQGDAAQRPLGRRVVSAQREARYEVEAGALLHAVRGRLVQAQLLAVLGLRARARAAWAASGGLPPQLPRRPVCCIQGPRAAVT